MDSHNSSERPLCPGLETGHFVYVFRVLWRPSGDHFGVAQLFEDKLSILFND